MHWIESSGGPLILLEKRYLEEWGGINSSSEPGYTSDYDRACDTNDYAEVIAIPSGQAVVFGEEPNRTSFTKISENEVIFVRWRWAPSESTVISNLQKLELSIFDDADVIHVRFQGEEIIVFDSSYKGGRAEDFLTIKIQRGLYALETTMYEPDSEMCLLLHRLRLIV